MIKRKINQTKSESQQKARFRRQCLCRWDFMVAGRARRRPLPAPGRGHERPRDELLGCPGQGGHTPWEPGSVCQKVELPRLLYGGFQAGVA